MSGIKIVKDAYEFEFSTNWTIKGIGWGRRSDLTQRAFAPGAVDKSDGEIKDNIITLSGMIENENILLFVTEKSLTYTALLKQDFKLFISINESYLNYWHVKKVLDVKEEWIEGQDYTAAQYEVTFLLSDPYAYYHTDDSTTITVDSSPKSGTVTNNGIVPDYPVITITADATITSLVIENETDVPEGASDGLQFQYLDNNFVGTDVLIIDCKKGTVERDGTNTIRYFSGSFLKLLPGSNTITVTCQTSGSTTVKFEYNRPRVA
jgi:hypothetical protein